MPILCRVTRGDLTESIHVIFATIVDDSGSVIYSSGDSNYLTCIKLFKILRVETNTLIQKILKF